MIPRNLAEFLHAVTSQISDVTQGEEERFQELTGEAREIVNTATMRIKIRIDSLDVAQRDYIKARDLYHDAIIQLAEDPHDDFETGYYKAHKWEEIETGFEQASARLNFELREAQKCGISPARSY